MKKGIIKFKDVLGEKGIKYDNWLDKQPEGFYLAYKQNFYADKYDFSIERFGYGASSSFVLANDINVIVKMIDKEIERDNLANKKKRERSDMER